jgi:DNA-binding MarR family transcriptional regulator
MHMRALNVLAAMALMVTDRAEDARVEASGLSSRELAALVLVANRPGMSVDWLYQRLGITQSGAVRLVERLVSAGVMTRQAVPGRREVELSATAAGAQRLELAEDARGPSLAGLMEALTSAEREHLTDLAATVLRAGSRVPREADVVCRRCDWAACTPDCPVEASITPHPIMSVSPISGG